MADGCFQKIMQAGVWSLDWGAKSMETLELGWLHSLEYENENNMNRGKNKTYM